VRKAIIALIAAMVFHGIVFAAPLGAEPGRQNPYPMIQGSINGDFYQFDDKGRFVPQTDPAVELKDGWVVLSNDEPVTLSLPFGLIVMQKSSILAISSLSAADPAFYLVAGSANFYTDPSFTGELTLTTPVSIYTLSGPGEVFITSDLSELVFVLDGQVKTYNTITGEHASAPPHTYMNMADPFMHEKAISQETFTKLSINPNPSIVEKLPNEDIDSIILAKAPARPAAVVEAPAPVVEAPAPVVEAVAPVVEAVAPVVEAVAPVVEAVAPAVEAVVPIIEEVRLSPPIATIQAVEFLLPELDTPTVSIVEVKKTAPPLLPPAIGTITVSPVLLAPAVSPIVEVTPIPTVVELPAPSVGVPVVSTPPAVQLVEKEETIVTAPIASVVNTQKTVKSEDDLLTIKQPLSITSSSTNIPKDTFDFGISSSFKASRGGFSSGNTFIGISINPFFSYNAFSIGLQAFFITDGDPLDPSAWDYTNINTDTSSVAGMIHSSLGFLDYIHYGSKGDAFYLSIDDHTPISFGKRVIVNHMAVASGPYEQQLGVYGSGSIGWFGYEFFLDDLYFNKMLDSVVVQDQFLGVRFIFKPTMDSYPFAIGISSLLKFNEDFNSLIAYPTLDVTLPIIDTRKLQMETFLSASVAMEVLPFSLDSTYNASGTSLEEKLPNAQMALGLDIGTLKWDVRLLGSLQNSSDATYPVVSTNFLNSTLYSGFRRLTDQGFYWDFGAEAAYTGPRTSMAASWYLPVAMDFSHIIPLSSDLTGNTTGDIASVQMEYKGDRLSLGLGIRRVGFLSSIADVLDFSDGFSGLVSDMVDFLVDGRETQPFLSMGYQAGLFAVHGQLSMARDGASFRPRIDFGAEMTFSAKALTNSKTISPTDTVIPGKQTVADNSRFSLDMNTMYTRVVDSSLSTNYLFLQPLLGYENKTLSIGVAPRVALDLDGSLEVSNWYSHDDNSPYSFGAGTSSLSAMIYDIASDVFKMVDHFSIGTPQDRSYFIISRDQQVSMGSLINGVSTTEDAPFATKLGLDAKLDTQSFDMRLFLNDLSDPQLGAMRLAIAPFKNWGGAVGLSVIGNLVLSDSTSRIDVFPALDFDLPFMESEKATAGMYLSITTMLGYSPVEGYRQMVLTGSSGSFLANLDNYVAEAGFKVEISQFAAKASAVLQKGALSYGMFDDFFMRNRSFLLELLESEWTTPAAGNGQTLLGAISLEWNGDSFDIGAQYQLPLSTAMVPDFTSDKLTLNSVWKFASGKLDFGYSRLGFVDALQDMLVTSTPIMTRIQNFLRTGENSLFVSASSVQGPIEFTGTIAFIAQYEDDGTWNGVTALPHTALNLAGVTVVPAITLGARVSIF